MIFSLLVDSDANIICANLSHISILFAAFVATMPGYHALTFDRLGNSVRSLINYLFFVRMSQNPPKIYRQAFLGMVVTNIASI